MNFHSASFSAALKRRLVLEELTLLSLLCEGHLILASLQQSALCFQCHSSTSFASQGYPPMPKQTTKLHKNRFQPEQWGELMSGVLKASTSEKPLELTRLVKQCSDILRLCHLVPSCKRKTRLPCFLPFRPMRAFPFAPLSHRPEHVCEPEAEDSRSVSQGILEFQLRGRSWERIWAKPSANAGLHFGIIDLFIYIYIYHFFQRLCR